MYQFEPLTPSDITPRALILAMMNSASTRHQTISDLVEAAAVFDIEPSAVRVAASRLVKDGILESPSRGEYRTAAQAERFTRRVQAWHKVTSKTVSWTGDWLVNLTHHLGRTDRRQLRTRERAFSLHGYREAETGVWVRPANLSASLQEHRQELIDLGVSASALTLKVTDKELPDRTDWTSLWATSDLTAYYQSAILAMKDSMTGLGDLTPIDAARESLLVGQAVIRAINLDPLLPDELTDNALFLEMVETMKAYNKAGRANWRAYRESL